MAMRSILWILMLAGNCCWADAYAPLADVSKVADPGKNAMARQLADARVPDANEVGVPAYPGAEIVQVKDLGQIRQGRYQVIRTLRLYSPDALDDVKAHYRAQNAGWRWRDADGQGSLSYPVQAAQNKDDLPGASANLLSGPRLSLADIHRDNHAQRPEIRQFLELVPGALTEIVVEFPGETSDLIDANDAVIANATQRCIATESNKLIESMGSQFPPGTTDEKKQQSTSMLASQHCSLLQRACSANPNKIACQRLLRLY